MAWHDVLDAFEAHLDLVEKALRGEVPWPGEFAAPSDTAAMPASARQRARKLLERNDSLAGALRERMRICADVLGQSQERDTTGRVVLLDLLA